MNQQQKPSANGELTPTAPIARSAAALVAFCVAHARLVVIAGLALTVLCGWYSAGHFRVNSDINALLPADLAWRQHELAFEGAFHRFNLLEAVVEAPTAELAALATSELTTALTADKATFPAVADAGGSAFFRGHALFFLPLDDLKRTVQGLVEGEPIIHDIATDRSLRGLVAGLEDALLGIQNNRLKLDDFARPLNQFSDAIESVLAGKPANFSWRVLTSGKPSSPLELRGFIEIRPALDFNDLQPGLKAETSVRDISAPIAAKRQANVRLTGPVAINDDQFGSIRENAVRNGVVTVLVVIFILWMALRSGRLIIALVINLIVGLAATAALGSLMVGAYNVISIYFAVLFVGIGVDFAIQFSVRYREERYRLGDLRLALRSAGGRVALPLALASLATAAGFFAFLPTDYRGVSELGEIAGVGMLVAFASSMTLLPALIQLFNPPGEPSELGYQFLVPVDNYLARHRIPIIVITLGVVVCASPFLLRLSFDDNPIDLQNPKSEAIATYLDLRRDPATGAQGIEVLSASLDQAKAVSAKLSALPEVASVRTLSTFIPDDQDAKLPIIRSAAAKLASAFSASEASAPPSDAENIDALKEAAGRLTQQAGDAQGPGAAAMRRLSHALAQLAEASPAIRGAAADTLLTPLNVDLDDLHQSLEAPPVTQDNLPRGIIDDWMTPDGRARLSVLPKGDPEDVGAMQTFARAVLAAEPTATEGPIATLEAGNMILHAFIEAGVCALASIAVLLVLFLRRISDVMLTLFPLMLAGLVTMELMSIGGLSFNFANIIALPLLLGVGVAFKIYYIIAWREGTTHLLQTPLTRAVFYSALTTATAFGSLWFSSHPGTSSMGKLLALSLVCTLAAAVLFQPILMGKPRNPSPNA